MAEMDATWRLTVIKDTKAKTQAKEFADAVLAETDRITRTPAMLTVDSDLKKVAAESRAFYKEQTKSVEAFEAQKVRVARAAHVAITTTADQMREHLKSNDDEVKAVAVKLAQEAAAEIRKLERQKLDFINRQNGLRVQADVQATRDQEAAGRASLARRLAAFKKAKAAEVAENKRAQDAIARATDRADRQLHASLRETDEAIRSVGDSFFRLGRGIVAIGLIGEKDMQKITDSLLAVQGAYDLFSASTGIVKGLTKAWTQYQAAVKAAAAAQLLLNAAQAAGNATGKASLLRSGFGGVGSFLGKTAAGKVAMIGGPLAAAAAGGKLAYDIAADRGTINPNSLSGRALGSTTNFAGSLDLAMGNKGSAAAKAVASSRALADFEKKTLAVIEQRKVLDEQINSLLAERKQQESKMLANLDQQLTLRLSGKSAIQQIQIINAEIQAQESRRSRDVEASQRRVFDLVQQRGEAEKRIAAERAAASKNALSASQSELATAKTRLATERETLDAARQRFGGMDRASQDEILALVKKARSGANLSTDELGKLSSLGTKEAERIVAQQKRNRVAGDYSQENSQLQSISAQRESLMAERRRIEREAPNKYDSEGNVTGKLVGRDRQQQYDQIDQRLQTLTNLAAQIRISAESDAKLRQSLFGGERADVARAAQHTTTLQAKVNHQINVVARFDNTAKQVAEQAVGKMMEAMRPFMDDVDREMQRIAKDVKGLVDTRRRTVPGRS